jgi:HEAT repeat protein
MRNRLYLVCGVLLVAALGWATWQAMRQPAPTEPVYEGKTFSYWLSHRANSALIGPDLKQKEFSVRYYAARALIRIDPEAVEPQKASEIPNIRIEVAVALGESGKDAKPAIPAVTALLRDTNPIIRNLATNALLKLDPEAAAKAGIKVPSPP